jgi:hypothetical protein
MNIRYGNDVVIADLERQLINEHKSMTEYLREGHLDAAFLRARTMQVKLDKLMDRLNELKWPIT